MNVVESVKWSSGGGAIRIVDQRLLPNQFIERDIESVDEVVSAIRDLSVRGAPAIGIVAAMGLALAARRLQGSPDYREQVAAAATLLRAARPTAVNLAWALDRVLHAGVNAASAPDAAALMVAEADAILEEDRSMCRSIGEHGATLLEDGMTVLTHCNTGALATAGIGTALGAIYVAHEQGKRLSVIASETRPLLQGSRLTAWELARAGIEVTVIADSAAASLLHGGVVDCCIVGADRITRHGDVANKIGTLSHAIIANACAVPFYVAAPSSTVDAATESGELVRIEERAAKEIIGGPLPAGVAVRNPAFDVTPAALVSAIVTDTGVFRPPYYFGLRERVKE